MVDWYGKPKVKPDNDTTETESVDTVPDDFKCPCGGAIVEASSASYAKVEDLDLLLAAFFEVAVESVLGLQLWFDG